MAADVFEDVVVSTDDAQTLALALDAGARDVRLRGPELSGDDVLFDRLIREDLPERCEEIGALSTSVALVLATAGLLEPQDCRAAFEMWQTNPLGLVITTVPAQGDALLVKHGNAWVPAEPGSGQPGMRDAGTLYMFDWKMAVKVVRLVDLSPVRTLVLANAVDVNDMDDWQEMERVFEARELMDRD